MSHNLDSNSSNMWRRACLGAAFLGSVLASGPAFADVAPLLSNQGNPTNGAPVDKFLSDAQNALKSGNIRLALITLKNAVAAAPHNAVARAQLGVVLLEAGDASTAERELRQARRDGAPELMVLPPLFEVMLGRGENQLLLDQFPDPGAASKSPAAADTLVARAVAFQNLKKGTEAVDAMNRSLALRRDGHGLVMRAKLSQALGNYPEAMKFVDEAIAKSQTPEALLFKISMLLATNDNNTAINLAHQLLAKFPSNLQGRFALVEIYLNLNQDAKAKAEVDDILAKYPNAYLATYYKSLLLARAGDVKGAWNLAQTISPDIRDAQPRIALMVAQMAVDAGNDDTGAGILNRLLTTNPDLTVARVRLASIRLKQNNPDEALSVLEPVKESSDPRVIELLPNVYLKLHRTNDALDGFRRLEAIAKDRNDVKRSIALLEIQTGHSDQGIKDLAQVALRDPTNISIVGPLINALTQARRFPEALAAADRLGADPKKRSAALVYRGSILAFQRDLAGAQAAFDKAVKTDPASIGALYSRAQFLAAQQKLDEANRDLRTILSLDGKNMLALLTLAEIAAQQGQDQNVRSILNQAIASSPENAAPHLSLMRYLNLRRKFQDTLAVANDLLRIQPNNTDGLALLAEAQSGLGQKKEAVASYRRLVSLMPTVSAPQILLGNALAAAGDRAGAARAMETAVSFSPNSPDVKSAQLGLLMAQGNMDGAVTSARSFQASNPGPEADVLLAETLERAKLRDEAVAVLNKSLSTKPNQGVLLRLVGLTAQTNDRKRAGDLMSSWLASNPNDITVRLEYGTWLLQQDDNAHATDQYRMVLKQDPNNVVALNNLGWLLQASDPQRALSLLTLAQKLSPNSADVADTLGWTKLQQKDVAGGLVLLGRAHTLQPQDGNITYHLVQGLDANGQRDAARKLLNALLVSGAKFKDQPAAAKLAAAWR